MDTYYFEGWTIRKDEVELSLGRTVSDEEFQKFAEELDGRMENFYNSLYEDLTDQMAKEAN